MRKLWQTGQELNDQLGLNYLSSRNVELLISVDRKGPGSMQAQVETHYRSEVVEKLRASGGTWTKAARRGPLSPQVASIARQLR